MAKTQKRKLDDRSSGDEDAPATAPEAAPSRPKRNPKKQKQSLAESSDDQDDDEGYEEELAEAKEKEDPTKRKKKDPKKRSKRRVPPKLVPDEVALSKLNATFRDYVKPMLQEQDVLLKITASMAKTMSTARLLRTISPTIESQDSSPIASLLTTTAIPGRSIKPRIPNSGMVTKLRLRGGRVLQGEFTQEVDSWSFHFENASEESKVRFQKDGIRIRFTDVPSSDITTAKKVRDSLINIMLRWPLPSLDVGQNTARQIAEIALADVLGARAPVIRGQTQEKSGFQQVIDYFDSTTGDATTHTVRLKPIDQHMAGVVVPSLPANLDMFEYSSPTKMDRMQRDANGALPYINWDTKHHSHNRPSSQQSQKLCQDLCRYVAVQCTDLVTTAERMTEMVAYWLSSCNYEGGSNLRRGGIYGNKPLYRIGRSERRGQTIIRLADPVRADMSGVKHPIITIASMLSGRIVPVLDAMISGYVQTHDPRVGFLRAARIADQVNLDIAEGIPPTLECDCTDEMAGTEVHPCHGCGQPCLCYKRSLDTLDRPVCPTCILRGKAGPRLKTSRDTEGSVAWAIIQSSFKTSFRRECKLRGIDPELAKNAKISEAALKELSQSQTLSGNNDLWHDGYTDEDLQVPAEVPMSSRNPTRRRRHPCRPTVDAVFPRAVAEGSRYFVHTTKNVVVTSPPLQYAKYMSLPGFLAELGKYAKIKDPTEEQQKAFVAAVDDLHHVRQKQKLTQTARTSEKVHTAKHHRDMREWISGKPVPNEPWPGQERLHDYIAQHFGKELTYSTVDNAPWIGPTFTMPANWTWNSWAVFCQERLVRMRTYCNKKWETRDTNQSLFAEIMWQCYCDDLQYGDRLRLPLVLSRGNPLKLSVAHKHHGFGMFSGWPPEPADVSERDDAANNMLIESWTMNCMKIDMDEMHYDLAIDLIKKIKVPTAYYDPTVTPPTDVDTSLVTLKGPAEFDECVGAMMNDDAVEVENADGEPAGTPSLKPVSGEHEIGEVDTGSGKEGEVGSEDEGEPTNDPKQVLLRKAKEQRARLVKGYADAIIENPEIITLLEDLQTHAENGDRPRFEYAQGRLDSVIEDDDLSD